MKVDNYCIALLFIVFFMIYTDNSNNIEYFTLEGAPLEVADSGPVGLGGETGSPVPGKNDTVEQGPIGQAPRKLDMKPPASMVSSMDMLSGAPIGSNYMLLSADMMPGLRSIDSAVPVAYPRSGGPGNLGKDSTDQPPLHLGKVSTDQPPLHPAAGPVKPVQLTGSGKSLKVIIIYAPWCGWSKKSLPDFNKMKDKLNSVSPSDVNGWSVSCELYNSEETVGKQKAKEYDVKGFPSVFLEVDGSRIEGPREYDKMIDLVNSKTGGNIKA